MVILNYNSRVNRFGRAIINGKPMRVTRMMWFRSLKSFDLMIKGGEADGMSVKLDMSDEYQRRRAADCRLSLQVPLSII